MNYTLHFDLVAAKDAERLHKDEVTWFGRLSGLLAAKVRLNVYLLWNLKKGECEFQSSGEDGRTNVLGTTTGSIFDGNLCVKRVFWCVGRQASPEGYLWVSQLNKKRV
jgi:hypothetical protein